MNTVDHLLVIVSEESHEISVAANAVGLFLAERGSESDISSCLVELGKEINDVIGVFELLKDEGVDFPGLITSSENLGRANPQVSFHELSLQANILGKLAAKALRFGLDDGYPGSDSTNRLDIVSAFNSLVMKAFPIFSRGQEIFNYEQINAKKNKVRHFLGYSKSKGRLS